MQYTFKTIEDFVKYCDDEAVTARRKMKEKSGVRPSLVSMEYRGRACAYEDIARILRNSNVGIIIPKEAKSC